MVFRGDLRNALSFPANATLDVRNDRVVVVGGARRDRRARVRRAAVEDMVAVVV